MRLESSTDQLPETLLLVDDNPTNLQVLHQTLSGSGHRLLVAQNGERALEIARRTPPALMLLDIMMPGMDGYEVCRRIKADDTLTGISVIFLSALDETADKVRGFGLGAVDYVTKPFHPEEVIARVETHLKIRRLERKLSARNQALEAANRRMAQDLQAAARVQRALLPDKAPVMAGVQLAWSYQPCEELAGDVLNLFALDDQRLGLFVVDVCGHGLPAALLAVSVSQEMRIARAGGPHTRARLRDPAGIAERLNRLFPMSGQSRLYFTLLYGVLDKSTHELAFVSAGNQGPTLVRNDGTVEILDVPALPIGLFPDSEYQTTRIRLAPGDRFYLHTDGLSEERNKSGDQYGRGRMTQALAAARGIPLEQGLSGLLDAVRRWSDREGLRDDIAVIGAQYGGE